MPKINAACNFSYDDCNTDKKRTAHEMEHKMKYDINLIQSWLSADKLTLNVMKTKYMVIWSQFKLSQINSDFTVKDNNTPLARVIKHPG